MSAPGRIVSLLDDEPSATQGSAGRRAIVDVSGVQRLIDVGLLGGDDVRPGDWIVIHMGYALSKIDAEEAAATIALLAQLPENDLPIAGTP